MTMGPILHVLTNLELGGAQISVADICMRLCERGFDMHLAYSSNGGRERASDGVLRRRLARSRVVLHDVPAMQHAIRPVRDVAAGLQLRRLMRRLAPRIVHTHMSKAGVLARLVAAQVGIPHVMHTARGWSFYGARGEVGRLLAVHAERLAAERTSVAFAVAHSLARDARDRRIGSVPYQIVRSGVDVARFAAARAARAECRRELGVAGAAPVVGFVSAFTPAKGVLDVPAIAQLVARTRPDVAFVIAGGGPLGPQLRAACARCGVLDRIQLVGQHAAIERVIAALDVLLVTSRWEGVPRVVIEALAAGVPVVATDVGGIREVVEPGRTGYIVPPGDIGAAADAVVAVLADTELAGHVARTAAPILDEHAIERTIEQHERVYRTLLGAAP